MAYFSNGTEGMALDNQCAKCKYGEDACPVYFVQYTFNYEACNNKTARAILDCLIHDDGKCEMYELIQQYKYKDRAQMKIDI